ncbi:MAG: LD-carboxypeptidase [Bdellovibrionaceae bacterium]|jgi:muramoyltetrapeptide carboxypeptidase|nr:LD-carboxypeptidase [Pseudobdellovibrionaceae bacterium]
MKIYVIAPGFPCEKNHLKNAIQLLRGQGHEVVVPKGLFGKDLLCANSLDHRIEHFRQALNSDAQVIWCVRGGYGCIEQLAALKKFKKPGQSKLIWGYSDITALHSFFVNQWGWSVMHGPVLDGVGTEGRITKASLRSAYDYLNGGKKNIIFKNLKPLNSLARIQRVIKSKLAGGNLATLSSLCGSEFQWNFKGKILFLEDIGERGYKVDRMLNQLLLSGSLNGVRAIVFGEFIGAKEPGGTSKVSKVLLNWSGKLKIPVLMGLKLGHGKNQPALPVNTKCELQLGSKAQLKAQYEYI